MTRCGRRALGGLSLLAALGSGCGAFSPPVHVDAPLRAAAEAPGALTIELVEGRPQGLVLRLRSREKLPAGSVVEVYRQPEAEAPRVFHRITLDPTRADALAGPGLDFVDPSMTPGARVRYFLLGEVSGDEARSPVVEVDWQAPPPRPPRPSAVAPTPVAVELRWELVTTGGDRRDGRRAEADKPPGALIFRRDLLHPERPVRRLMVTAPGVRRFVDRDVDPAGVYAYRVALAWRDDDVVQYGPASEEVYVTVAGSDEPFARPRPVDPRDEPPAP